jgi:hypothetical protein
MPRPMPRPAPVTSATRPAKRARPSVLTDTLEAVIDCLSSHGDG